MASTPATTAFVAPRAPVSKFVAVTRHISTSSTLLQAADVDVDYDLISTTLQNVDINYDTISLVVGQENYGLAVVVLGEALWSTVSAPSLTNAARVCIPAGLAALILVAVSGPMVTSGDPSQIATGLGISTAVTIGLLASYALRLSARFSPAPKEIAALGLIVSVAGFFSFAQNLIVDGFVILPELPHIDLPSFEMPNFELPTVEVPTIEMPSLPTVEVPTVEVPTVEVPTVEVPTVEVPKPTVYSME